MIKSKLLILDLDGTIREPKSNNKFINDPLDQHPIKGVIEAIDFYHKNNWRIIGCSNQAGIAAGYKSLESCFQEMQQTLRIFPQLDSIFFCPDFEGKECYQIKDNGYELCSVWNHALNYRKPGIGMIKIARFYANSFSIQKIEEIWMIGDREEDELAAKNAKINFLDAEIWRARFNQGIHKFDNLSLEQIKFLENLS